MGGMTFFQLMEKEWNYWGAYDGNQSIDQVAQAVADDILDGFRDTDEAQEYIEGMPDNVVLYTAMGYEMNIEAIQIAINVSKGE